MGPSGSGKTSLLNVISQQTGVSAKSIVRGKVKINGRLVQRGDYGKVGAFVQQDDVLMATMTVKEVLYFAARMRTKLDGHGVKNRVGSLIERLGLEACQNTIVGNWQMKGISGGERKRTSIAYELVTEPSLLLLDEPTSGLDSLNALRVINILKSEALRGVSVLTTIH